MPAATRPPAPTKRFRNAAWLVQARFARAASAAGSFFSAAFNASRFASGSSASAWSSATSSGNARTMAAANIGTSVTRPRTRRVCSAFRSLAATAGHASVEAPLRGLSGYASVSMEVTPAAARSLIELVPGWPLMRTPVCRAAVTIAR